jgi:ubiquinone/menaquinone biosynthesis C-methylase UbiE
MLAVVEDHARRRGLVNMTFQQADAEALPFPSHRFDVVTCRFGIMFCPNAGQAFREIARVLKPGGRAAFIVWGPFDQNPYFTSCSLAKIAHSSLFDRVTLSYEWTQEAPRCHGGGLAPGDDGGREEKQSA